MPVPAFPSSEPACLFNLQVNGTHGHHMLLDMEGTWAGEVLVSMKQSGILQAYTKVSLE